MALKLPAAGGDTGFLNMYQAFDTLPASLARRIEGLTLKHDATYNSVGQLRENFQDVTDVTASPGASHPIVRIHHETGRKALFLGRRNCAYVNGLSLDESEELLDALWEHVTQERFNWHHKWRLGDLVIWDNRCTMHRRDAFARRCRANYAPDPNHRRGAGTSKENGMTLRAVDLHLLKLPLTVPYHLAFGDVTDFDTIVVEVLGRRRPHRVTARRRCLPPTAERRWKNAWAFSSGAGREGLVGQDDGGRQGDSGSVVARLSLLGHRLYHSHRNAGGPFDSVAGGGNPGAVPGAGQRHRPRRHTRRGGTPVGRRVRDA